MYNVQNRTFTSHFGTNLFTSTSLNLSKKEKLDRAQKIVDRANSENKGKWTAKVNHRIAQLENHSILGAKVKGLGPPPSFNKTSIKSTKLRQKRQSDNVNFDVRTEWPACAGIVGTIQVINERIIK